MNNIRNASMVLVITMLVCAGSAFAQMPPAGTPWQFDITGLLQEAKLDGVGSGALQGGHLKVNGQLVTVPSNIIVILPANALTWQEIFAQAPAPYGPGQSGLALADTPAPLTTYEAHVIGNVMPVGSQGPNGTRTSSEYIAGLIEISQEGLNTGAGYIANIDYAKGELQIVNSDGTVVRVQINDPTGRFGRIMTPDQRFTVDSDNPTIRSETGFPMCIPRTDPAVTDDPDCPQGNRPKNLVGVFVGSFSMQDPATNPVALDPRKQAPFEIGDYITFSGTMVRDGINPTAGPLLATDTTYISAHTITNNIAIYTAPGTNPAYTAIDVTIVGTGGLTVLGAGEAAVRTRFEGFTTDPTRPIHLYGIDLNPLTGATTDRDWGTIGVDQGPPVGAVRGRWRFRPPCLAFGATPTVKDCVMNQSGTFLPPTREVRAVIEGLQSQAGSAPLFSANGLIYGQYHAPILEYIFPENIPGAAVPPNNFESIPFLAQGGYTSTAGTLAGQLNPWPGAFVPGATCAAAVAGGPYLVDSGGSVTLAGSISGTSSATIAWTTPTLGTLSATNILNPIYTAPTVATSITVPLTLTVTSACGTSTSTTSVAVSTASSPVITPVIPITVYSGSPGSFVVTSTATTGLPLTFTVTQTGVPALTGLTVTNGSTGNTATVSFTAPPLPLGQVTSSVINLTITATNQSGVVSAPAFTTVTIKPLPDLLAITTAEYRTGKRRLSITATSSVIGPNVVLKLQPYLTVTGTVYDPDPAFGGLGNTFTNNGGGLYTIDLVGVPEPAIPPATPLTVKSNLNGTSPATALTRIRN